jgi:hypothetical protein
VGDRLCRLGQTALVESLENQSQSEVYNLVVSDFHTFFVGKSRLLVEFLTLPDGESPRALQVKEGWRRRVR